MLKSLKMDEFKFNPFYKKPNSSLLPLGLSTEKLSYKTNTKNKTKQKTPGLFITGKGAHICTNVSRRV